MPLIRNTGQTKTLIEFYTELKDSSDYTSQGVGTHMLNWIERINQEFKVTKIWGLTSLYRLILQAEDNYASTNHVILMAIDDEYYIEYQIPKESAPWENAFVKGSAASLDEAMRMLKIAMVNSKGWDDSAELKS